MPNRDIVVIGGSAGSIEALSELVKGLPRDLPAVLLVVVHLWPYGTSILPDLLTHLGSLPARHARDGDPLEPGRIYVAPPDYHLTVRDGAVKVAQGPRENRHRPAVDPLFRSAARAFGPRVIGVVLSGSMDDGSEGLLAIKRAGGLTVVQDPATAAFPDMPGNAMNYVQVDHCVAIGEMASLVAGLVRETAPAAPPPRGPDAEGPSLLTCPECRGPLQERQEGALLHFACLEGHAFSPESMMGRQSESVESALWAAVRALEDCAGLYGRMATQAGTRQHDDSLKRYHEMAGDRKSQAATLRQLIVDLTPPPPWETGSAP